MLKLHYILIEEFPWKLLLYAYTRTCNCYNLENCQISSSVPFSFVFFLFFSFFIGTKIKCIF